MDEADLVVIGAGPAGLAATRAAVRHGLRVILLDENAMAGGQYFRHAATDALRRIAAEVFDEPTRGAELLRIVGSPLVDFRPDTSVLGFYDRTLAVARNGVLDCLAPRCVVVTAGATERPRPFPGWTLPGVIGAGAVQNLLKTQRIIPGRRILVAGNGPLSLLAACNLLRLGAQVVAVIEAAAVRPSPRMLPSLLLEPTILARGIGYQRTLRRHGITVRTGWMVLEAFGDDRVEGALIAPIVDRGIDRAAALRLEVDTIVAGYGLRCSSELTRTLGCAHVHDAGGGGWIPVRSAALETSCPGIFAAGDCAGTGGAERALLEGTLAGLNAAHALGRARGRADRLRRALLRARLARLGRFRHAIETLYAPPAALTAPPEDRTIICRCEEVTAGQIRDRLAQGITDTDRLKSATRVGMGRCQGLNCLSTMLEIIAGARGCPVAMLPPPRARPPVRPVSLAAFADSASDHPYGSCETADAAIEKGA